MAVRKRALRPDRNARLAALEVSIRRSSEEGPTIGDLRADLDSDARAVLDVWLEALSSPVGSVDRAGVCCKIHGLRRVYRWLRTPEPATVDGLRQIDDQYRCS